LDVRHFVVELDLKWFGPVGFYQREATASLIGAGFRRVAVSDTGNPAGQIAAPERYYDLWGGNDGSELAAAYSQAEKVLLMAWNMSNGPMTAARQS